MEFRHPYDNRKLTVKIKGTVHACTCTVLKHNHGYMEHGLMPNDAGGHCAHIRLGNDTNVTL